MDRILALLPTVNAVLISVSGLFILWGIRLVRRGERERHRRAMLTATGLTTLFLILYVTRVFLGGLSTFSGPAWLRPIYLAILISHFTLAIVQTPLVVAALAGVPRGYFRPTGAWAG